MSRDGIADQEPAIADEVQRALEEARIEVDPEALHVLALEEVRRYAHLLEEWLDSVGPPSLDLVARTRAMLGR